MMITSLLLTFGVVTLALGVHNDSILWLIVGGLTMGAYSILRFEE